MVASESVALDVLQFDRLRDVQPGECVYVENSGVLHSRAFEGEVRHTPCIFEYVYFARPDSILDDLSVYKARLRMGEQLAGKIVRDFPDHDIDVVIPIPDTSRTAALQVAYHLGVKYREGFIKNRYIGRTFIMPGQAERAQSVRRKLNAIDLEFRGKNVLLVDDSIVRGTTSRQIIKLAREAGAQKVYFASAAPPVRYPNVYGIDMPAASELIANGRSVEEIEQLIGADRLIYQDLHGLIRSVRHGQLGDFRVRHVLFLRRIRHGRRYQGIPERARRASQRCREAGASVEAEAGGQRRRPLDTGNCPRSRTSAANEHQGHDHRRAGGVSQPAHASRDHPLA